MPRRDQRPKILRWSDIEHNRDADAVLPGEDLIFFDIKVLAEGDSWFSLNDILPRGKLPTNLLDHLKFKKSAMIVSCAYPGDTMKKMSQIGRNHDLRTALRETPNWDVILLSGGGNDLLNNTNNILMKIDDRPANVANVEEYCNLVQFQALLDEIKKQYISIARARDRSPNRVVPIVTHTYDYPTPRDSPARFINKPITGPWIYREFVDANFLIPVEHWIELASYLVDRLAETILSLASPKSPDYIENFYVTDTRGTLEPAELGEKRESGQWVNEFHPTSDGYKKLATKWYRVFNRLGV